MISNYVPSYQTITRSHFLKVYIKALLKDSRPLRWFWSSGCAVGGSLIYSLYLALVVEAKFIKGVE
jgi:hypothetical protein